MEAQSILPQNLSYSIKDLPKRFIKNVFTFLVNGV